jgi:hypothetical protein
MGSGIITELKSKGIVFSQKKRKRKGYHGTSKEISKRILATGFDFAFANPRCWLGLGFYFFDNAPFAGSQFALCFARHSRNITNAVVLESDLYFKLLLDLTEPKNRIQFWRLRNLLRRQAADPNEIDEKFVAFYIGTHIANAMNSDGVGWEFELSEPGEKQQGKKKMQRGFAVKKLSVISSVSHCKVDDRKSLA